MIDRPYLLVMTLPCYVAPDGTRSLHELWHQDLVGHLANIDHLILAAPVVHGGTPDRTLPIDHSKLPGRLSFVDLPACNSTRQTVRNLPTIAARLWRAVGQAEIVHGNAGGWPLSFGWLAIPMAKLRGKFALTNVESGSWRLGFNRPRRLKPFVEACLYEGMGRLIVNLADIATFTHDGYRVSMMLPWRRRRGYIFSASWIKEADILDQPSAEARAVAKVADPDRPLKVVFAATLKEPKGWRVLLAAAQLLQGRNVAVHLDIYGQGPDRAEVEKQVAAIGGSVTARMCATVEYGAPFFEMLLDHDLMVVPTLSDEQPRVIYDCCARALPVIATATAGNAECVTDGVNGRLVPVGDAPALADAIEWAASHRAQLAEMGIKALGVAHALTHDQMHANRAAIVAAAYARKTGRPQPIS